VVLLPKNLSVTAAILKLILRLIEETILPKSCYKKIKRNIIKNQL
jgi:hypothetical protein